MSLTLSAIGLLFVAAGPDIRFEPPVPRQGDLVIVYVKPKAREVHQGTVEVFGYGFDLQRISAEEMRAAVAVPIGAEAKAHRIGWQADGRRGEGLLRVQKRSFDSSKLSVSRKFTKKRKSKALRRRLRREHKEIRAVWRAEPSLPRAFGGVHRPAKGQFTGIFGTRRIFNGKRKSTHYGLDFDGKTGDPVTACLPGKVILSSMRWGSGGTLVIDHGGGFFTSYYHLSQRIVKKGQWVGSGEMIGKVGKSGRVTGPHLHLSVVVRATYLSGKKQGQSRSMYVDPQAFLKRQFEADLAYLERRPSQK